MKKTMILSVLCIVLCLYARAQQEVENLTSSVYAVPNVRPAGFEFRTGTDSLLVTTPTKKPSMSKSGMHFTYPVLFVHGLGMKAESWNTLTDSMDVYYGTNFGGRFDFCLNYDGSDSHSNLYFWPTANADMTLFSGTWVPGDYYYLNFDVGDDGSYNPINWGHDVKSRMSAAFKQGKAVSEAVRRILQITGKDKVILVAFSMGGLALRQYIQNPSLWQADGKHHIAKIVTAGSPLGGSNASLSEFGDWIMSVDDRSEGSRDVKRSYSISGDSAVFVYGGWETYSVIDNMMLSDYYNVDVNCNGQEGDYVVGLNQKAMPRDLDFANIIGNCGSCGGQEIPGDGLVRIINANFNTYYPNLTKNIFYYYSNNPIHVHGDLQQLLFLIMEGMDEANDYSVAYGIEFDNTYTSFITPQPMGGYSSDYDDFKFSIPSNSYVKLDVSNINISDLKARFVDLSGNVIGTEVHSNGASTLSFTKPLNAGSYYLEIYGSPTYHTYLHPYNFKLTKTMNTTEVETLDEADKILVYPNPAKDILYIDGIKNKTDIKIYDMLGNIVYETLTQNNTSMNVTNLPTGIYTLVTENAKEKVFKKIVISKD